MSHSDIWPRNHTRLAFMTSIIPVDPETGIEMDVFVRIIVIDEGKCVSVIDVVRLRN